MAYSLRRERQPAPRSRRGLASRVDGQVGDLDDLRRQRRTASQQRAQSGEQLVELERLDEIVVRARVEAGDLVVHAVARGEHEDRRSNVARAERSGHLQAVALGQHDVEHDRVVGVDECFDDGSLTVADDVDGVRVLAKALRERLRQQGVVLRNQQSHRRLAGSVAPAKG